MIPANHQNMTKFSSDEDPGFKTVSKILRRWVKDIEQRGLDTIQEPRESSTLTVASSDTTY